MSEVGPGGDLLAELRKEGSARTGTLVPVLYAELRKLAHHYLSHERPGHTLQATALVHEVYLAPDSPERRPTGTTAENSSASPRT